MRTSALWGFLAFLALAPCARADLGTVQSIDGNHIVISTMLMNLRLGERMEISVFPQRDYGIGQGIVTDIDKTIGLIAVVILPYRPAPKADKGSSFGEIAVQGFIYSKGAKTFWLYLNDLVYLDPFEKFTLDYPRYKLPPVQAMKANVSKDIDFPYSIYHALTTTSQ